MKIGLQKFTQQEIDYLIEFLEKQEEDYLNAKLLQALRECFFGKGKSEKKDKLLNKIEDLEQKLSYEKRLNRDIGNSISNQNKKIKDLESELETLSEKAALQEKLITALEQK